MIAYYAMPGLKFHPKINRVVSPDRIIWVVADRFRLTPAQVTSKAEGTAIARGVAMYLCKKLTVLSHFQVARMFGCNQHGASIHAGRTVTGNMRDPVFKSIVNEIESLI